MSPLDPSIPGRVAAAALVGVQRGAEAVVEVTIPLTPRLTGTLRSSLQVVTEASAHGASAAVFSELDYSVYQHEAPDSWRRSEPGTGSKFLEKGTAAAEPRVQTAIAGALREALS